MIGWMSSKLKQTTGHDNPMPKKNDGPLMVFPYTATCRHQANLSWRIFPVCTVLSFDLPNPDIAERDFPHIRPWSHLNAYKASSVATISKGAKVMSVDLDLNTAPDSSNRDVIGLVDSAMKSRERGCRVRQNSCIVGN